MDSISGKRMLGYISPIYGSSRIMQAIMDADGHEIDAIRARVIDIQMQLFPQTATWGLVYWENCLGIPTNERAPYQDRRNRVITKIQQRWPITPAKMEIYISSISGGIPVEIVQNVADYTFRAEFMYTLYAGEPLNLIEVAKTIEDVKPAHMACQLCVVYNVGVRSIEKHRAWLFDYPLCNTYKTGIYPDITIIGRIIACPATIDSTMSVTAFDYMLTGTEPIISTIGVALKTKCDAEVSLSFYGFDYKLCGTGPIPGTKGLVEKTNIDVTNELTAARFLYPECGALLCGTYPAA